MFARRRRSANFFTRKRHPSAHPPPLPPSSPPPPPPHARWLSDATRGDEDSRNARTAAAAASAAVAVEKRAARVERRVRVSRRFKDRRLRPAVSAPQLSAPPAGWTTDRRAAFARLLSPSALQTDDDDAEARGGGSGGVRVLRLPAAMGENSNGSNDGVYQPQDYTREWDDRAYLEQYYSGDAVSCGMRLCLFALPNFFEVLRQTLPDDRRVSLIDVGAGPTIFSAVAARHLVRQVWLADYVRANLERLDDWLHARDDFDWRPVIKVIAK